MRNNNSLLIPPLSKPTVDPQLPHLPPIERSAEVLKYSSQCFEHSVSPGGGLRKVLKIIGLVAVIALAAFPVVCIAGVIATILAAIISNLLFVVFGLLILYFIGKAFTRKH